MKTVFTLITLCILASQIIAQTTRSVSNHALGGAQHSNLQSAYNAATNNDILIIEGTSTPYELPGGGNVWNKSLVVIGQGINTQKQGFATTKFHYAGWSFSFTCFSNSAGSKFYGIDFSPAYVQLENVSNILFENCIFRTEVRVMGNSDNIVFKNCIFQQNVVINLGACMNWLITNSVLNGQIVGANTPQSIIVDHCLFLSSGGCFQNVTQAEVKNSIFMNSPGITGITNSNFQNNHARLGIDGDGDVESYFRFPETGNNYNIGGNLVGADPMMVEYPFGTLYSPAHDYHLQQGSLAIGAAADGTDIGVHGGFTHFSERGEPMVTPVIRSMNVINTSVAPGGTLSVHVVASKPFSN